MVKTIIHDKPMLFLALVVAFFVGASITGVFFDYDAEAKKTQDPIFKVGGENIIKMKKGTATCTDQDGFCGEGKLRAKLHLISTGIEGNVITGNAKGVIQGSGWGWLVSESSSSKQTELRDDGPLSYDYHTGTRILTMTGNLVDKNGLGYSFDAIGNIAEPKNSKAKIDFTIQLVNENGIVIDATGAGFIEREGGDNLF